jgi:hypothetical protein
LKHVIFLPLYACKGTYKMLREIFQLVPGLLAYNIAAGISSSVSIVNKILPRVAPDSFKSFLAAKIFIPCVQDLQRYAEIYEKSDSDRIKRNAINVWVTTYTLLVHTIEQIIGYMDYLRAVKSGRYLIECERIAQVMYSIKSLTEEYRKDFEEYFTKEKVNSEKGLLFFRVAQFYEALNAELHTFEEIERVIK